MPLDSLLELVETLKQRIAEHGSALRSNETLTRYALIDPFLRELGWDTSDPDVVAPEYRVPNGMVADYALLAKGKPVMIVESKRLDESLQGGKALDQGILYSTHSQTNYFLLTDGRRWEVYNFAGLDRTKPEIRFDLVEDPIAEVCLMALALWRRSVEQGTLLAGQAPLLPTSTTPTKIDIEDGARPVPPKSPAELDWTIITSLGSVTGKPSPVELLPPTGPSVPVNSWKDLMLRSIDWLVSTGRLTSGHMPLKLTRGKRYEVSTTPHHSDGRDMLVPHKVQSFFVEAHVSANQAVRLAVRAIEHAGQDPTAFKVRFS